METDYSISKLLLASRMGLEEEREERKAQLCAEKVLREHWPSRCPQPFPVALPFHKTHTSVPEINVIC